MERLSTGQRINSAKDDAAGLAIATTITSQVRGMNQAVRNANDGIALAQTADGGLNEVTNMLQRVRELSVQSKSGTYQASDRTNLQAEVTQLQSQITDILSNTKFNGVKVNVQAQADEVRIGVGALTFTVPYNSLVPCVGSGQVDGGEIILTCTTDTVPPALQAAGVRPVSGAIWPFSMSKQVLFPAPFGPIRARISPAFRLNDTLRTAWMPP